MNIKKLASFFVVIFVLFWIISQPTHASHSVNNLVDDLRQAGTSVATFMTNVL